MDPRSQPAQPQSHPNRVRPPLPLALSPLVASERRSRNPNEIPLCHSGWAQLFPRLFGRRASSTPWPREAGELDAVSVQRRPDLPAKLRNAWAWGFRSRETSARTLGGYFHTPTLLWIEIQMEKKNPTTTTMQRNKMKMQSPKRVGSEDYPCAPLEVPSWFRRPHPDLRTVCLPLLSTAGFGRRARANPHTASAPHAHSS